MITYEDPVTVEQEELDKAESALRMALEVIEHVEYVRWSHDWWRCPWCHKGLNDYGHERMLSGEKFEHHEYCSRQEAIRKIKELLP